jgi:hypothetical protein
MPQMDSITYSNIILSFSVLYVGWYLLWNIHGPIVIVLFTFTTKILIIIRARLHCLLIKR